MYLPNKTYTDKPVPVEPIEAWRKALLDAAEYIRVHGWCQHVHRNSSGNVCAIGALKEVAAPIVESAAHMVMIRYLGSVPVSWWNDAPERTAEEVVEALLSAARQ